MRNLDYKTLNMVLDGEAYSIKYLPGQERAVARAIRGNPDFEKGDRATAFHKLGLISMDSLVRILS